jgi:hypothetical protein
VPLSTKELKSILEHIEAFRKFLILGQMQRQLEPSTRLLTTLESMARGAVEQKSLTQQMVEAQTSGKEIFRRSSFEEQMLATALGNLTTHDVTAGVGDLVKSLELVLDVYVTSLEKTNFKQEDTFSIA